MAPRTLCWLTLFILVAALALRTQAILRPADTDSIYREQAAYEYLRDVIKSRYVKEVGEEKLFYGAMEGMTSALDSHSRFFPPKEYEAFEVQTTGQMEGVGIEIDPGVERGITVLTPLLDTPAWRGGILPGDRILKINGQDAEELTSEQARNLIKGPEGTSVTLAVRHEGEKGTVEIVLERAVFEIKSVPVAEMLDGEWVPGGAPKIGYIQVNGFQQKTAEDLEAALNMLEAAGMQGLLLDLRQNPGGLLRSAEEICDFFLKDGPIVSVIGRSGEDGKPFNQTASAHEAGTHPDYPIVVLLDSKSASASEIVSGCLRDRGRAVLVGDHSYGKFSVQEVIPLNLRPLGKAALKLTTARYKTPVGDCIDGKGIVPDYVVPSSSAFQRALNLSRLQRHLKDNNPRAGGPVRDAREVFASEDADEDGAAPPLPNEPFVDTQMKKAVEVMIQRIKNPVPAAPPADIPSAASLDARNQDTRN